MTRRTPSWWFVALPLMALPSLRLEAKDLLVTTVVDTTKLDVQRRPRATNLRQRGDCTLQAESICRIEFSDSLEGVFKDFTGLPLLDNPTPFTVGVVRYNLEFDQGGTFTLPFSILAADVTGSTDQQEVNNLKLLDPDLGKVTFKGTYAWKYRLGSFCQFYGASPRGQCTFGIDLGLRYLSLDALQADSTTNDEHAFGGFVSFANSWSFPITQAGQSGDKGRLVLKFGATAYKQNLSDSAVLFPDAIDPQGNPLAFDDSYTAIHASLDFYITDRFSIQAKRFRAKSHDVLDDETTFTVSFDVPKQ